MSTWARQTKELFQGRKAITPDDLPCHGSLVWTTDGYMVEVVGWFAPNQNEASAFAHERLCFGFMLDGPLPTNVSAGGMVSSYFPESAILRSEPQKYPKFGQWLVDVLLAEPPA